jgi:Cytochrome c554 and c-prime
VNVITTRMSWRRGIALLAVLPVGLLAYGAGCTSSTTESPAPKLSRAELLDAQTCKECHADHYREWSGSMHAYAADDPVFRAMNARGQRETGGQLGTFCVNCHAPMAVQEGATTDGLNLDKVDPKLKGVTCFFCHQADAVEGSHNGQLRLASDLTMRGRYADPVENKAHAATYSANHDGTQTDSARMCGACHDIVNGHGVAIERTFQEWDKSVFGVTPNGLSCAQCHMKPESRVPIAQAPNVYQRERHEHTFEAVDVAVTPWPETKAQAEKIDVMLSQTLAVALCVQILGTGAAVQVIADNAGAGHAFPSGSAQDRRLWFEVQAFQGENPQPIYQSGAVPSSEDPKPATDPDLWLFRDHFFDDANEEVHMFWEAKRYETYLLPTKPPPAPLRSTHLIRRYPRDPNVLLTTRPDRVTLRVLLRPIGLDVLDDLVKTGDLDPAIRQATRPPHLVGAALEWTPANAAATNLPYSARNEASGTCVTSVPDRPTALNLVQANCSADDPTQCSL